MGPRLTRRHFIAATASGAALSACAPAASPGGADVPQTGAQWEREWNELLAAARKEGKLAVISIFSQGSRRRIYETYEDAFGIPVEESSFTSLSAFTPRVAEEQKAGIFTWDVGLLSGSRGITLLRDAGNADPIRPLLFRPDATDDAAWRDGFDAGFPDKEKQWGYCPGFDVSAHVWVNTDLVREGELRTARDLLDPKWKGKMVLADVRSGYTSLPATAMRLTYGEDFLKQLFVDQQPTYSRDDRLITESMVRGRNPIATGIPQSILDEFQAQGLGKNIKQVRLSDIVYGQLGAPVSVLRNPPHPNAAKLFVNWVLTKEGQTVFSQSTLQNSRRLDVPPSNPANYPEPGVKVERIFGTEALIEEQFKTEKILVDLVQK